MIIFNDLTLSRSSKVLFEKATLQINPGEKWGLVGANGSGKSSLLSFLRGEITEDKGSLSIPRHWRMSSVAQEWVAGSQSALSFVMAGDIVWASVQKRLEAAEAQADGEAIIACHEALSDMDGYRVESRAGELLHGLGFTTSQQKQSISDFSGGWQMRLNLARALMKPCDLLLLDEPTNHLDLDAILWLEKWLQRFVGTVIVIAHDSLFLDKIATHIMCVEDQEMITHKGNYSDFLSWRVEQRAQQQKFREQQEKKREHLQSFINRFKAKASKAKQAQSRIKMLAKLEVVAQIQAHAAFQMTMHSTGSCPNPVIRFKGAQMGYGDKTILKQVSLHIGPAARIGLLGANGAGKSTLMKTMAGVLPLISGEKTLGTALKIGYFAQHQMDILKGDESPLRHLENLDSVARVGNLQSYRTFLGKFGFSGDMALNPIEHFSGGEKARLVLALLAWQKPHLLLLDEPTNHLDLETRQALTLALQEFEGAVVLVSHDRQLLSSVVDCFYLVHNGQMTEYDDTLDQYAEWLYRERKKDL